MKSSMTITEIQESIALTARLAKDNYDARNQIIDRLNSTVVNDVRSKAPYIAGECVHYFHGLNCQEVKLECRCSPTVKGGIRFSYKVNEKVIALPNVYLKLVDLGV